MIIIITIIMIIGTLMLKPTISLDLELGEVFVISPKKKKWKIYEVEKLEYGNSFFILWLIDNTIR